MANNKWKQPKNPPPPLFLGKKERDLTKQVNDELIERVIGQTIIYFPLDVTNTNYHPLYGEAINKEFGSPVVIKALIKLEVDQTTNETYGLDKESRLKINFHKRRLTEDQNLYVREGDIVFYDMRFYEIVKLAEPRLLFGQIDYKIEIQASCIRARGGFFDEPIEISKVRQEILETGGVKVDPTLGTCGGLIRLVSGNPNSPTYQQFLNYVTNPKDYEGCIIYLVDVGTNLFDPFLRPKNFYFNENGTWFRSPFLLEFV